MPEIDADKEIQFQAAAFRRLRDHLRERTDVQNVDLMNLAGFCRNCLSRWYQEAATADGEEMTKDDARESFYGMPYEEWRERFQAEERGNSRADGAVADGDAHGGASGA